MVGWPQRWEGQHKVKEDGESHRARGLPDDLLNILKDDLATCAASVMNRS